MTMRKSRKAQVAELPQEKQAEYYRNRRRAITWGWIHLWTFPAFSWSTLTALIYLTGNQDNKSLGLTVIFGSFIPLIVLAIVAGKQRKKFAKLAAAIRTENQPT